MDENLTPYGDVQTLTHLLKELGGLDQDLMTCSDIATAEDTELVLDRLSNRHVCEKKGGNDGDDAERRGSTYLAVPDWVPERVSIPA